MPCVKSETIVASHLPLSRKGLGFTVSINALAMGNKHSAAHTLVVQPIQSAAENLTIVFVIHDIAAARILRVQVIVATDRGSPPYSSTDTVTAIKCQFRRMFACSKTPTRRNLTTRPTR